jgi:CelD/BcsL family acetyltransferase involved in cellulose biosynthesis
MKVSLIPGRKLSEDLVGAWMGLQQTNPDLVSPYFHPKFSGIVANACANVELAIIEEPNGIAACFPFQRMMGNIGVPVGHFLSDYHGLICEPRYWCDPRDLMRQCRLIAWDFDHLVASQPFFAPYHQSVWPSPQIDLSDGFESYCRETKAVKREQIKIRNLTRDYGPLRFVAHAPDQASLQQLLMWKSEQYTKTGKRDIFVQPWTTSVVQDIHATQEHHFSGKLSLLYAGNRVVAAHLAIRSGSILHSWIGAYDPQLAKYSPGLILLLKIAEHAPSIGIKTIDLGAGMSEWKQRFMNASACLATGSVELPSLRYARRALRRNVRSLAVRLNLHGPARNLVQAIRSRRG